MPRLLYHPFFVTIVTLVAILLWASFWLNSREIRQSSLVVDKLQTEVTQQENAVSQAEKQLEAAQSPQKKEQIIRNELLMQKPGEYIVQMPDIEVAESKTALTPEIQPPWKKWRVLLGLKK